MFWIYLNEDSEYFNNDDDGLKYICLNYGFEIILQVKNYNFDIECKEIEWFINYVINF